MTTDELRIDANPEKRFFISMLTKDIELIPAVVDLIDNSVDAARKLRGDGSLQRLRVDLTIDADRFEIRDNCGGIEADVARHYAFRFGRPLDFAGVASSVGQFGVGMKRALFKLGTEFSITSVAEQSRFTVTVNVPEWEKDKYFDWSFQFSELEEGKTQPAKSRGTRIVASPLLQSVSEDFVRPETATRIAQTIAIQHQNALGRGLVVRVNNTPVKPVVPMLLQSKSVSPIREQFDVKVEDGVVSVDLIAGIAAAVRRDTRDPAEAEQFTDPGEAGWYVFCNDRLVISADKSETTGWGVAGAAYHPQYRRFRGYVFLSAKDSSLLPWNTTKTALDQDSHVFRVVQQKMMQTLSTVQVILNRQKAEVAQREEDDRPLTDALAAAKETPLADLPVSSTYKAPPIPPRQPPAPPTTSSIQFKVDRIQLEDALTIANMPSAGKLGLTAYEYYLQYELGMDV